MLSRPLYPVFLFQSTQDFRDFSCSSVGKESACKAGDQGSIPGPGRSPGEGNGNLLQYACLENPKDRGAWQAKIHGVTRVRHDLATKPPPAGLFNFPFDIFAGSFSIGGRGSKNVSVIPALDLFNMPVTPRPRGRERPGAAEESARYHKNHSYSKCNQMAQVCPRPTLEEACHNPVSQHPI